MTCKDLSCFREESGEYISTVVNCGANQSIPITLTSNKSNGGKKGIVAFVYGAYGAYVTNRYNEFRQVLMDAGFTTAQCHVRGSRSKGWPWYHEGRRQNKEKTFEDYIECINYLRSEHLSDTGILIGYGQSAGGLVLGVAINRHPHIFDAAVFDYPYLDPLTTMCRDTLPLTLTEYSEWGNPQKTEDYSVLQKYSPYQNVRKASFPPMLFQMGLRDTSTPYWQVLKAVQKYRINNLNINTNIFASISHGGHPGTIPYPLRMKELTEQVLFMTDVKLATE